jgi:rhodanese-related sulfurtransferase
MNARQKFTVGLLSLGLILALLPPSSSLSFTVKPERLLREVLGENIYMSVDQVARFIVREDSSIQLIDLRPADDFRKINIPGSINIPYSKLLNRDPGFFLNTEKTKTIFYSNGDLESGYALSIANGLNYKNIYCMKGGLNGWFITVMNSSFTGERISARENALFETRMKARKIFTEINSLPDSLKIKYIEAQHLASKQLDGGCE